VQSAASPPCVMQTSTARWGSAPNDMVLSSSFNFKKETFNDMYIVLSMLKDKRQITMLT
jgi:hypothetical protein